MKSNILYYNKIPFRFVFIFQVIFGFLLLALFVFLLIDGFYLDVWIFAGPLLGLAILITGLTGLKIKKITLDPLTSQVMIIKESLFKIKTLYISTEKMSIELKDTDKGSLILKLKLVILENDKEIEKMESSFLSINNSKIKQLYYDLKEIIKEQ